MQELASVIVSNYGPIGVAVFVIWRKQNKLEKEFKKNQQIKREKINDNSSRITQIENRLTRNNNNARSNQ